MIYLCRLRVCLSQHRRFFRDPKDNEHDSKDNEQRHADDDSDAKSDGHPDSFEIMNMCWLSVQRDQTPEILSLGSRFVPHPSCMAFGILPARCPSRERMPFYPPSASTSDLPVRIRSPERSEPVGDVPCAPSRVNAARS